VAGGLYRPRNYDDHFRGLVTARIALAGSLNVPAVRTLGLVGAEAMVQQLRRLGFDLPEAGDYYGPSLALGSVDVTLWELASAYRALAAGGVWTSPRLSPATPAGAPRRVYSHEAAFLVSSILADRESRSVTFGLENPLATGFWTAVKTGTSKDMRDNWAVGYSPRFTVGAWVGNYSGAPMRNVSGVTGAAPVWLEVMTWLHAGSATASAPAPPPGLIARAMPGPDGGAGRPEWFVRGTEPVAEAGRAHVASGGARIVAPVSGTIIALDPDIPPALQRVIFEASAADAGMRWVLDGADCGPAASLLPWAPRPGRHRLALVSGAGAIRDAVTFEVRGTAARPEAPGD
jgi:penicillin-binding protein 1C